MGYLLQIFSYLALLLSLHNLVLAGNQDISKERILFSIGTDLFQNQYKEQKIKFDDYEVFKEPIFHVTKASVAISYKPFKSQYIYLTFKTNELLNFPETFISTSGMAVTSKSIGRSLLLSHPVSLTLMPYFIVTSIESESMFFTNGKNFITHKSTTLHGVGISYRFKKYHSVSFTYYLGDSILNTNRSLAVSYNYTFALPKKSITLISEEKTLNTLTK